MPDGGNAQLLRQPAAPIRGAVGDNAKAEALLPQGRQPLLQPRVHRPVIPGNQGVVHIGNNALYPLCFERLRVQLKDIVQVLPRKQQPALQ